MWRCRNDLLLLSQLPHRLNECDNEGNIPLNLALLNRHEGIAITLVSHKCDLDCVDTEGNSLLHLAILRGDSFAASFLIKSGCNTTLARHSTLERPLHLVASYNPSQVLHTEGNNMYMHYHESDRKCVSSEESLSCPTWDSNLVRHGRSSQGGEERRGSGLLSILW